MEKRLVQATLEAACSALVNDLLGIVTSYVVWDIRSLRKDDIVEACDDSNRWFLAVIAEISAVVQVHFIGWSSIYDRRIPSCSSTECGSSSCWCFQVREPRSMRFAHFPQHPHELRVGDKTMVDNQPVVVRFINNEEGNCDMELVRSIWQSTTTASRKRKR